VHGGATVGQLGVRENRVTVERSHEPDADTRDRVWCEALLNAECGGFVVGLADEQPVWLTVLALEACRPCGAGVRLRQQTLGFVRREFFVAAGDGRTDHSYDAGETEDSHR